MYCDLTSKVVFVRTLISSITDISIKTENAVFDLQIRSLWIEFFSVVDQGLNQLSKPFFLLLIEVIIGMKPLRCVVFLHGFEKFQSYCKHFFKKIKLKNLTFPFVKIQFSSLKLLFTNIFSPDSNCDKDKEKEKSLTFTQKSDDFHLWICSEKLQSKPDNWIHSKEICR